jgi:hypothetical protein
VRDVFLVRCSSTPPTNWLPWVRYRLGTVCSTSARAAGLLELKRCLVELRCGNGLVSLSEGAVGESRCLPAEECWER